MTLPVALDEFALHQTPLSMRYVPTSDRNFYDRYYFNAHDRTGEVFFVAGAGVYPNLGVRDAFATVRRGDRQWVVRCSDALDERALSTEIGPYRIEVLEPLQRLHLVCEPSGGESDLAFDLTWEGSFPAVMEQPHVLRNGSRAILDASRFAQVGTWEGTLVCGGDELRVSPETWLGTRDRSWGIRPVGEAEPAGRPADPVGGFWWLYVPLRFDDFALVVICQEDAEGDRTLNDASRVWPDGRVERLGWPRVAIDYEPGTRHPRQARLSLQTRDGSTVEVEIETLGFVALHVGAGYGGDPDWTHGAWRGREWVDRAVYDLSDPDVRARIPFGVVDHVAKATCDGATGWGLFEHASVGRHAPSGFDDFASVAPAG